MNAYESTTIHMPRQESGTCALVQDLLPLYLEGEVSPGSRDVIVEHLAQCERCAGFLAGTQSARAQLRRDAAQRAQIVSRDQPAQQALSINQRRAMLFAMMVLCALGGFGSALVAFGMGHGGPGPFFVGLPICLVCFGGLAALARKYSPLTPLRWFSLVTSCLVGAFGAVMVALPSDGPPKMIGMVLAFVGMAGVWLTVEQRVQRLQSE
jgi:predicted anti-sigma-YlaC factor YlaD